LPFVELAWRKKVSLRVVRETFVAVAGAGFWHWVFKVVFLPFKVCRVYFR
jgi:hypothetical protein